MKVIIAPDKFKGTLTSFEACQAISDGIAEVDRSVQLLSFPMADGGDGFAAVMKYYLQTETVNCPTVDPLERKLSASYEWNAKTKTAVIEMAVASGLVLLKNEERNPLKASSYGTGLLITDAIDKGATKIVLGLGGSATNDAGTGILSALGFRFTDSNDKPLKACGENLLHIETIVSPVLCRDIKFEVACDVQNVLYGPQGAAYVYARQKGADDNAVVLLDNGLKHFAEVVKKQTGKDIADIPGTGAAGGIAAGLITYFDVQLRRGIQLVIEASRMEEHIKGTDLLITGEGKIDEQTLKGKVVSEIALLAAQNKIPVAAFCGISELSEGRTNRLGAEFIETLVSASVSKEQAINNARVLLMNKVARFFKDHFVNKSY